jgi:hypothetical protein
LELVDYRRTWGEHRVYFHDEKSRLRAMPAGWTDAGAPDPFVTLAAGRAHFRIEDLVQLAALVGRRKACGADSRGGASRTRVIGNMPLLLS